jgi:hypothetical protein
MEQGIVHLIKVVDLRNRSWKPECVYELLSARIWQHQLCVTLPTNVNINYCLPIKVYYRFCTLRHIRIEINHGSQNTDIRQPMLELKTHSGESQSHALANVKMRLYPIDKSLVCLQSERRTSC